MVDELSQLTLREHTPGGAEEGLAPKSRVGFRIAHQLSPIDTLLLLASVIEIGTKIESRRLPIDSSSAFAYRFRDTGKGQIFHDEHFYKQWTAHLLNEAELPFVKYVVSTDISDFYSRVYIHRLDNLLDAVAPSHPAVSYIKRAIKAIRARRSFGLPVGGSASRLLAELVLSDVDRALRDRNITFTRYIDDFRIFATEEEPYVELAFLAKQLNGEGLALNSSKTRIDTRDEFLDDLQYTSTNPVEAAEELALEALMSSFYADEDPDEVDVQALTELNLLEMLDSELARSHSDYRKIRKLFVALRVTVPHASIEFVTENFDRMIFFGKETTLLMQELQREWSCSFESLERQVVAAVLSPTSESLDVNRYWLLELLVRGIVPVSPNQLSRLKVLETVLDRRALHLIRGRLGLDYEFRNRRMSFSSMPRMEQSAFVIGASCMAGDEYEHWLGTIRPQFRGPTCDLFLRWAKRLGSSLVLHATSGFDAGEAPDD